MAVAYPSQLVTYDQFQPYRRPVAYYIQQDYVDENDSESDYDSDIEFAAMEDDSQDRDVEPTVVEQLLGFAEMVNRDIHNYFSKRKILEEITDVRACDKRNGKQLSGREQYYADLMKVVEGENSPDESKKSPPPPMVCYDRGDNRGRPIARTNNHTELGGLEDLFEYARQNDCSYMLSSGTSIGSDNLTTETERHGGTLPWKRRNLPSSFFLEPNGEKRHLFDYSTNDTPDFSDLMANIADEDPVSIPLPVTMPCQACR